MGCPELTGHFKFKHPVLGPWVAPPVITRALCGDMGQLIPPLPTHRRTSWACPCSAWSSWSRRRRCGGLSRLPSSCSARRGCDARALAGPGPGARRGLRERPGGPQRTPEADLLAARSTAFNLGSGAQGGRSRGKPSGRGEDSLPSPTPPAPPEKPQPRGPVASSGGPGPGCWR